MKEFFIFGLKQAYASIFGGYLLCIMAISHYWYPFESLHRYDAIFIAALAFQIMMLVFKWESYREALVILVFHIVATIMEVFKTSEAIGAWHYPEEYLLGIGNVPLFTGFMYSAIGSYLARVTHLFQLEYTHYPKDRYTIFLICGIYINFFSHHYVNDIRWLLFAVTVLLFWKTQVHFTPLTRTRKMPILFGWLLIAAFIWLAENIATYVNIWIYPHQTDSWVMVPLTKLSSWYLLMLLSFVLLRLIKIPKEKVTPKSSTLLMIKDNPATPSKVTVIKGRA